MANANRAARRRAQRAHDKEVHSRGAPPPQQPDGGHGVDVDRDDNGYVHFTLYGGYMTITVKWSERDAGQVAEMIRRAAEGETEKAVEVVRESGLVVPPQGMTL